jgi:cytochrome c oxidase cbb3-type subunit III
MPRNSILKLLVVGAAIGALVTLGAAADYPLSGTDAATNAATAEQLIHVPVTGIIPGNIDIDPNIKSPVANDSEAATRGMRYFDAFNCSGCHAANAGGGMGPALSNRDFTYGGKPENIYLTIAQGRPKGMPAWGTLLPSNVIWDLVAYVKSISNSPQPDWGTTTSLDAFKIEQVPAEFQSTPTPWKYTEPFSFGQEPSGKAKSSMNTE